MGDPPSRERRPASHSYDRNALRSQGHTFEYSTVNSALDVHWCRGYMEHLSPLLRRAVFIPKNHM